MATATATATTTDYLAWDVRAYSGLLEDCTGFTVHVATDDEGELCYQLTDAYGDAYGEPWYEWADVVAETLDAIEAYVADVVDDTLDTLDTLDTDVVDVVDDTLDAIEAHLQAVGA